MYVNIGYVYFTSNESYFLAFASPGSFNVFSSSSSFVQFASVTDILFVLYMFVIYSVAFTRDHFLTVKRPEFVSPNTFGSKYETDNFVPFSFSQNVHDFQACSSRIWNVVIFGSTGPDVSHLPVIAYNCNENVSKGYWVRPYIIRSWSIHAPTRLGRVQLYKYVGIGRLRANGVCFSLGDAEITRTTKRRWPLSVFVRLNDVIRQKSLPLR